MNRWIGILGCVLIPVLLAAGPMHADAQGSEQEYLIATGSIGTDGSVRVQNFRILEMPVGTDDAPGSGPYSLELQDANGTVLFVRYFELREVSELTEVMPFTEILPYDPDTAQIQLKRDLDVLKTIVVSVSTPSVTVIYPNGDEFLSGEQTISWTATDLDGDTLTYDVLYSADGGENWFVVAVHHDQPSFVWDTDSVPGGSQSRIRVLATDGVNTGQDDSDSLFTVARKFPEPVIVSPADQAQSFLNERIIFEGVGFDIEDGPLADDALIWSSDLDGSIGTGGSVALSDLSSGKHTIVLSVQDSDGNVGDASIMVNVSSAVDSDGDGVEDDFDNCPLIRNDQADFDGDGLGDACDDSDSDGYLDAWDTCAVIPNDQQSLIDTTPPATPQCNAPATIVPPDAPISFTATSTDNCGSVSTEIRGFSCVKLTKKNRLVDKTESCEVSIDGDTITIIDSGGVGDQISWTAAATDLSGNETDTTCELNVVNPGKSSKSKKSKESKEGKKN